MIRSASLALLCKVQGLSGGQAALPWRFGLAAPSAAVAVFAQMMSTCWSSWRWLRCPNYVSGRSVRRCIPESATYPTVSVASSKSVTSGGSKPCAPGRPCTSPCLGSRRSSWCSQPGSSGNTCRSQACDCASLPHRGGVDCDTRASWPCAGFSTPAVWSFVDNDRVHTVGAREFNRSNKTPSLMSMRGRGAG